MTSPWRPAVLAVSVACGLTFSAMQTGSAVGTGSPSAADSTSAAARTAAPSHLHIGAIGLDAPIIRLGLKQDGSLQVPSSASLTGWFTGSPRPGAQGPAVVVGHVHWNGQSGVFADLSKLDYDDRIAISRSNGTKAVFRVTRVSRFKKNQFPSELVYGNVDTPQLRLITCDGYDAYGNIYRDNLVVFAMLVQPAVR